MDSSIYLDEGLLADILKRLPIDVLCRFRCVCKSWKSLISSSSFVRSQYLSSSNSVESKPFILFDTQIECSTKYAFYNPHQLSQSDSQHSVTFQTVPFDAGFRDIGVIHGVVCLSLEEVYDNDPDDPDDRVWGYTILWNPTIRKFVKISRLDSMRDVGFGFDGSKNDFKVIRTDFDGEKPTAFEVYSSREGCSRPVDSDHIGPFDLVNIYHSCFKNGAIHWIIRRRNWPMAMEILMFDCKTEELKTMELPQPFNQGDVTVERGSIVFLHSGKVSVLVATKTKGDDKAEAAVWVMDEYGVPRSWRKTAYHNDMTHITQNGISILKLEDGSCCYAWTRSKVQGMKRSQQPWDGHVFEPSMLLMDHPQSVTTSRNHGFLSFNVSFSVINE